MYYSLSILDHIYSLLITINHLYQGLGCGGEEDCQMPPVAHLALLSDFGSSLIHYPSSIMCDLYSTMKDFVLFITYHFLSILYHIYSLSITIYHLYEGSGCGGKEDCQMPPVTRLALLPDSGFIVYYLIIDNGVGG